MTKMNDTEILKMRIKRIEKEIRDTPYHKGTEHHIGRLRARLSKLREEEIGKSTKKRGNTGGYAVKKQGDATVVLVGPPSAGKSTLLNKLTNAKSKIAPYAFTTVSVIPGMMSYKNAQIQILDVPGLIEGAEEGKGRGREVLSVVRACDLLVLISDIQRPEAVSRIADALERNGIRINKTPPGISVNKKIGGGIEVKTNIRSINKNKVETMANEFGIKNAEIKINEMVSDKDIIDIFAGNREYIPALFVLNKLDMVKSKKEKGVDLYISSEDETGLEDLRELIWDKLGLVRIYLVKRDEKPGRQSPLIVNTSHNLHDVAKEIGTEFAEGKNRAQIWGPGAKFPGQEVSLATQVQEGMRVRFL